MQGLMVVGFIVDEISRLVMSLGATRRICNAANLHENIRT